MKFIASPGIILVEPIKETTKVLIEKNQDAKIKFGKVVGIGGSVQTDTGAILVPNDYCSIGDIIYFLSYESDLDRIRLEGNDYFLVKFQDVRGVYES